MSDATNVTARPLPTWLGCRMEVQLSVVERPSTTPNRHSVSVRNQP